MSRRPRSRKVCRLPSLFFTLGKDKCVKRKIKANLMCTFSSCTYNSWYETQLKNACNLVSPSKQDSQNTLALTFAKKFR